MLNSISGTEKKGRISMCWSEERVVSPGTQMENNKEILCFCFFVCLF